MFPKHTLARQGNTAYLIPTKDFFTSNSYNVIPPQIIPTNTEIDSASINLAGQFLCSPNGSSKINTCSDRNRSTWNFRKIPNTTNYQIFDVLSKACMAIGSHINSKDAYLLVEKKCDKNDESQSFFGIKVSSKTDKNIVYLNKYGKEVPEPEVTS